MESNQNLIRANKQPAYNATKTDGTEARREGAASPDSQHPANANVRTHSPAGAETPRRPSRASPGRPSQDPRLQRTTPRGAKTPKAWAASRRGAGARPAFSTAHQVLPAPVLGQPPRRLYRLSPLLLREGRPLQGCEMTENERWLRWRVLQLVSPLLGTCEAGLGQGCRSFLQRPRPLVRGPGAVAAHGAAPQPRECTSC